ncbi:alpha/beta hydrolase [Lichenihabitans sp. Uapishka_5]|uniref:alpha/beta fold hydrolase n=1 Tax=Lichenihabitans sp. Uapishka_5 TaxID=3037302 RepID=UPI0029E7E4EF|nr:alpha/beta hydrolase [Lichenihabitans sp. Uapishka_5]MDX7952775.1 alpha/beta hydrolase [Lichenihabitans sp. Uapishka_5]
MTIADKDAGPATIAPATRVRTPILDMEVFDAGPRDAPAVLLLHGWPDAASTWDRVSPHLNAAGFRTIAPTWRGFGGTRFRDPATPRTGDSAILAHDAIDLMDALGLERVYVAGHDWGSNATEAMAVGWPGRIRAMAMLSTPPRLGGIPTPPFAQAQRQWYHWFMATARGAAAVHADPKGFGRLMWDNWSPPGWYGEDTFAAAAHAWENPGWADVTLHSYRARWDEAAPDPRSAALSAAVKATKTIDTPTLYIHGALDGVNPPETAEGVAAKFSGPFDRLMLDGVGHFPPREMPGEVAKALVRHFGP